MGRARGRVGGGGDGESAERVGGYWGREHIVGWLWEEVMGVGVLIEYVSKVWVPSGPRISSMIRRRARAAGNCSTAARVAS